MKEHGVLRSLSGKNVLITGGLGFVGSNLACRCLELGARVSIYDSLDAHCGGNEYNVAGIRHDIQIYKDDIMDLDAMKKAMSGQEVIFHCAASTSHRYSMLNPFQNTNVNCLGTLNVLESARVTNPEARIVYTGTTTQLGKLLYTPADIAHPESPLDIYSVNKSAAERYILIYAASYGMNTTSVRLPNIYGPRASIHSPLFTFNNYFIGLALQDKEILVYGSGEQKRNVLYVEDAVEALVAIAERGTGLIGKAVMAVSNEHHSIVDIAEATVREIGSGKVRYVPWPEGLKNSDVGDAVFSNDEIKRQIGWGPRTTLLEGLKKTKAYYSNCLGHYMR
jgi:UDP-glucose 4-epimerase